MTSDTPPDGAQPFSSAEPAAVKPIHRRPNRVVLQADVAADGSRKSERRARGRRRGHPGPRPRTRGDPRLWAGGSEYEWAWRIPAASLPALLAALDGQPGDDPVELVYHWSVAHPGRDPGSALKRADVPLEFWNRVVD